MSRNKQGQSHTTRRFPSVHQGAIHEIAVRRFHGRRADAPHHSPSLDAASQRQGADGRMGSGPEGQVVREATLHRIQQLIHEKAMFAPIWQLAAMGGFGPRVEEREAQGKGKLSLSRYSMQLRLPKP